MSRWKLPSSVDAYFEVTRRGSTVAHEVRGGAATFLTMSYILLVNPQILSAWARGAPGELQKEIGADIATATALTCGIGSILAGVLARMPFAIGPGMGLNTLVAGILLLACKGDQCNVAAAQESMALAATTTFILGAVVLVLSCVDATRFVLLLLPSTLKTAIMVGIGVFQAFIGLREMHIIQADGASLLKLEQLGYGGLDFSVGDKFDPASGWAQALFMACLLCMSVLFRRECPGSILIAITCTTALSWIFGIGGGEAVVPFTSPKLEHTLGKLDMKGWFEPHNLYKYGLELLSMFLILIFDVAGVSFGIARAIDLPNVKKSTPSSDSGLRGDAPQDGDLLPGRTGQCIFASVGLTTMLSGILGCSPCIVFLECTAGVKEGARTGLASVVTGLLFLLSCFLTPVFQHVPLCASAAPLVFVGCLMMGHVGDIEWDDLNHALPSFLCIIMMPFSNSITVGIGFGLALYMVMALMSRIEKADVHPDAYQALGPASPRTSVQSKSSTRTGKNSSNMADDEFEVHGPSPLEDMYRPTRRRCTHDPIFSPASIGLPR